MFCTIKIGSCVLKASVVECRSTLLINAWSLSWHSIGTPLTCQSRDNYFLIDAYEVSRHLVDYQPIGDQVLFHCRPIIYRYVSWVTIEMSIKGIDREDCLTLNRGCHHYTMSTNKPENLIIVILCITELWRLMPQCFGPFNFIETCYFDLLFFLLVWYYASSGRRSQISCTRVNARSIY